MTGPRHIAVIDIGKTNAKLALVDLATRAEIAVTTRPNRVIPGPPWPHFDTEGHWQFILDGLRDLHAQHGVDAISVTTHGASGVLLDAQGGLAAPVLDYEHTGPDDMAAAYDALRPDFALTGSPRLPMGLNLGAQLHWQFATDPGLRDRVATLVSYPQYWGFRLTGVRASDVTSLGCHTDLWNPATGQPSPLLEALGLAGKLAPPRRPADLLGHITPGVAAATGLPADTPVAVGIHDSNASLLPHLMARRGAFSVVSTGTWVVVMTVGGDPVTLDPARDTLVNVNAFGQPVSSARFMGGREHDLILQGQPASPPDTTPNTRPSAADRAAVLAGLMLLPAVQPGSGPYPQARSHWHPAPPTSTGQCSLALGYYLALMTTTCLAMTGSRGPVIVEGPFARNTAYLDMLTVATGQPVIASASQTGTAMGAALLFAPGATLPARDDHPHPAPPDTAALRAYAASWQARAQA
jgi:sugar (pentulose or hexulose) kinase